MFALLVGMAGLEMGPGDDSVDLAVLVPVGPDRMAGLLRILVHPGRHPADRGGDHRLRLGIVGGIIQADLAERQVGGHDDVAGRDGAAVGDDPVRLVVDRPAVLEDVAAVAGQGRGEPGDIFDRVELGLIVPAHRLQHVEGQAGVAGEAGREAEPPGDLDLLLELAT